MNDKRNPHTQKLSFSLFFLNKRQNDLAFDLVDGALGVFDVGHVGGWDPTRIRGDGSAVGEGAGGGEGGEHGGVHDPWRGE